MPSTTLLSLQLIDRGIRPLIWEDGARNDPHSQWQDLCIVASLGAENPHSSPKRDVSPQLLLEQVSIKSSISIKSQFWGRWKLLISQTRILLHNNQNHKGSYASSRGSFPGYLSHGQPKRYTNLPQMPLSSPKKERKKIVAMEQGHLTIWACAN